MTDTFEAELEARLRAAADRVVVEDQLNDVIAAQGAGVFRRPAPPRRPVALFAACLLVVGSVGVVALLRSGAEPGDRPRTPATAPTGSVEPTTPSASSAPVGTGPTTAALFSEVPADLVFRGSTAEPGGLMAPLVHFWTNSSSISIDVGTVGVNFDVDRAADVETAIATAVSDGPYRRLAWSDPAGAVISVSGFNAHDDLVNEVARNANALRSTGRPLEDLTPPNGYVRFSPPSFLLAGRPRRRLRSAVDERRRHQGRQHRHSRHAATARLHHRSRSWTSRRHQRPPDLHRGADPHRHHPDPRANRG